MRHLLLRALALSLPLALSASASAGRCAKGCERWVEEPKARARLCSRCLSDDRPGAWLTAAAEHPRHKRYARAALQDEDPTTVAAAAFAISRRGPERPAELLCPAFQRPEPAPAVALHALLLLAPAAAAGDPAARASFCAGTPAAPAFQLARARLEQELAARLGAEVYAVESGAGLAALRDLARLWGEPASRALARTLAARPVGVADAIAADRIEALADGGAGTIGALLREGAEPSLRGAFDRLLGQLGRRVEEASLPLGHADAEVRRRAVAALARYGPLAADRLERAAREDADWMVRWRAAEAISRDGGLSAAARFAALLDDADPAVATRAAETLAGAAPEGGDALFGARLDDATLPAERRAALVRALAGEGAAGRGRLAAELHAAEPGRRAAAAAALAPFARDSATAGMLAARIEAEPDPALRLQLALALAAGGQPACFAPLVAALDEVDPSIRARAVDGLGVLGGPSTELPLLRRLERDEDEGVRRAAAVALSGRGAPRVRAALDQAARHDPSEAVRIAARAAANAGRRPE